LLLLVGLVSLSVTPYSVLMPIFAGRILHGDARQLGMLMGATGIGAVMGGLTLASRTGIKGLGRWVWAAASGLGLSLVAFSFSRQLWLSIAVLVPAGFSLMIQMGAANTLLQVMVPNRLRGRVMSLYSMMFVGMAPIGALLGGVVADRIGAPHTVAIGGLLCLAGGAIFARKLPAMRTEARELIRAQEMIAADPSGSFPVSHS
jgi:MFS family permease